MFYAWEKPKKLEAWPTNFLLEIIYNERDGRDSVQMACELFSKIFFLFCTNKKAGHFGVDTDQIQFSHTHIAIHENDIIVSDAEGSNSGGGFVDPIG